jgi:hypothetical protein
MSSQMTITVTTPTSTSTTTQRVISCDQAWLQVSASALFGIRFRRELTLSQKIYPADEDETDPDYNNNNSTGESDDFIIPAKAGKTRHAPNGRQNQRQAKNIELNNEIKKAVKRNAKIDQSQLPDYLKEEDPVKRTTTRPSKNDQRRNSQYRASNQDFKAHRDVPSPF